MPNISASAYDHFHQCNRLYYWQHIIKLTRAREEGARRFGTMYHAGLEQWWKVMDGGDVPWRDKDSALVAALGGIHENAKHIETDPYEVARAEAMMLAYHARYFELDFESVHAEGGVELWFNMPLLDPDGKVVPGWRVTGRKDVMKRFADRRVKPVEHKTTTSEIDLASDYWARLKVDMQCSIYIDSARFSGIDTHEVLYDVSRKPGNKPSKATPKEKHRYTKGKGCTSCGGRAGGKGGVAQGTGKVMLTVEKAGKKVDVEATCQACEGSGWSEAPKLHADVRLQDEPVMDFKMRVADELREDPEAYFRQGIIQRTDEQLMSARANLVVTTGIIGSLTSLARSATRSGEMGEQKAMECFAQNTQTCTSIYGRRCDYLDVCSGAADPWRSPLYQIGKPRDGKRKTITQDEQGRVVATSNTAPEE